MSRDAPLVVLDDGDGDGDDEAMVDDDTAAEIIMLAAPPPGIRFAPHRPPSSRMSTTSASTNTNKLRVTVEQEQENQEQDRVEGYLVVDTNFVLDHAQWLRETRHAWWGAGAPRRGGGLLALVVPWTVLRELDGLKTRRHSAPPASAAAAVGARAQDALRVLLGLVQESPRDVVVQRAAERATGPAGPVAAAAAPSNDDRILECAVHYMWFHAAAPRPCTAPRAAARPAPALLLSGDVNLCVKAHAYDISTMAWRDVVARKAFPELSVGGGGCSFSSTENSLLPAPEHLLPLPLPLPRNDVDSRRTREKKGKGVEKRKQRAQAQAQALLMLHGTGDADAPITLDSDDSADEMVDDDEEARPAKRSRGTTDCSESANAKSPPEGVQKEVKEVIVEQKPTPPAVQEKGLDDPLDVETVVVESKPKPEAKDESNNEKGRRVVTVRVEPLKRAHKTTALGAMDSEAKYSLVKWVFGLLESTLGLECEKHLNSTMKDVCTFTSLTHRHKHGLFLFI